MATPSTVELVHPEIAVAAKRQTQESRLRRMLRRRGRKLHRTFHSDWREEATLRGMTRLGA